MLSLVLSYIHLAAYSEFINEYAATLDKADKAIVYFSKATLESKKLQEIDIKDIVAAFNKSGLLVFDDPKAFQEFLFEHEWNNSILLMMSSGNFGNFNLRTSLDLF